MRPPFAARVRPPQRQDAAIAAAHVWITDSSAAANAVVGMAPAFSLTARLQAPDG